jgi:hypothetical protein
MSSFAWKPRVSDASELLVLRLGLIGIIFVFVLAVSLTMRSGLRPRGRPGLAAPLATGRPRLVVLVPGQTGLNPADEIPLAGEMTVGRDPGNSIVLGDQSVSGRHASLTYTREGWRIADLGSTNGTFVNGRPLGRRRPTLRVGDDLAFGSVVVRFQR